MKQFSMSGNQDITRSTSWMAESAAVLSTHANSGIAVTVNFWHNDTLYYDSPSTEDPLAGYPYPSLYSMTHIAISSFIVTIIMLIIVAGNVLVIVAIAVDRNLKGTQNWFIASLAVSDLLVGLFIMPLSLANELIGYWPFGDILCQLWLSTDVLLCTASILNLVLISLDRYWSITKAISYVRGRTKRRAVAMIAIVWLLSMVICLPPLVGWNRPQPKKYGFPLCILSEEPGYVVYSTVGSFYLPLTVMVFVYFKIYLVARGHARRHRKKYAFAANANGLSNISMANTTINNDISRNHARIHRQLYMDENSRVSQIPEISSDMSNSVHTPDPDPEYNYAESCLPSCGKEEISGTASCNSDRNLRKHQETEATDSQGDTPTRFLLPNARTINLPAVNELENYPSSDSPNGGLNLSRKRRAKSLPGGDDGTKEGGGIGGFTTLNVARHLWQSRSHRDSPSRGLELTNRSNNQVGIPTIRIYSDSKELESLDAKTRENAMSIFRQKHAFPDSTANRPNCLSDDLETIDVQQRLRRRTARMKERRATFVLGIVMASFIGCWLPFFSLYPISLLAGFEVPPAVFAFIFWLGYINSALNPIIYTIFNREFRQAFKRLLSGRRKH